MMTRLALALSFCLALPALAQPKPPPPAKTPGEVLSNQLSIVENDVVPLVEAMPEDKLDFRPTGAEFKDVRTFKQQAGHLGAALIAFSGFLTGTKPDLQPNDLQNGPALKSKAELVAFLKKAFSTAHAAAKTVTVKNELEEIKTPFGFNGAKMGFGSFLTWHSFDHYGQMVVYARMNGIVPPASRNQGGPPPAPPAASTDAGTPDAGR